MDENGNVTAYTIDQGSSGFDAFMQRIEPFADLECSVEIMTIPAAEVIGKMSGRESLDIDWMIGGAVMIYKLRVSRREIPTR